MNDIQIQALADGEADGAAAAHAAGCARCGERVQERRLLMGAIARSIDVPVPVPATLANSVEEIFRLKAETTGRQAEITGRQAEATGRQAAATGSQKGATRLLTPTSGSFRLQAEHRRGWLYGGFAVAAATIVAVIFVVPAVRTPDATVSAAEILAKSASQLSTPIAAGVEVREYQLVLDGVPKEMMPDGADGTYVIRQAIDHDVKGRFRFASYGPDGKMLTSIAQDPEKSRRVMAFTVEGQPYRFDVTLPARQAGLSLPEMERLHMEASIAMMQASGNQLVETIDGPHGKQYRIEVPGVSGPGTSPVWDLTHARVLIDARDYRVIEFEVSGSFLKQPYSVSYRQITHSVVGWLSADSWVVPAQPGEIVITGEGSDVPTHDVVVLSLRALTKLKRGQ